MNEAGHQSSATPLRRLLDCLLTATAIGLLTGVVEACVLGFRRQILEQMVWASEDQAWLVPCAYVVLFGGVGLAAGVLATVMPRRVTPAAVAGLLTVPAVVGILELLFRQRLLLVAEVVLGLGVAYQIWRACQRNELRAAQVARSVSLVLGVGVLALAGGMSGWEAWRRREALAELPEPRADALNILLIILDAVRSNSLSLYGSGRPTTPNLERWADSATVYEYAIASSSWTLPSHVSLFTGRWPHELEPATTQIGQFNVMSSKPLGDAHATLAEVLRTRGYATAAFMGNSFFTTRESGLARGFLWYFDYRSSAKELLLATELGQLAWRLQNTDQRTLARHHHFKEARHVSGEFLDWLDERPAKPFLAVLNYFDAHEPYRGPDSLMPFFRTANHKLDRYEAAIRVLDQTVDDLVRELDGRGLLERTIVVVTSDHGEEFGEHGLTGHGTSLYPQSVRVPLVIRHPDRLAEARRVLQPVSLRDLPTTLLDLAGVEAPDIPGVPFETPAYDTATVLSELTPSHTVDSTWRQARGEIRSVVAGRYQYISNVGIPDELFDIWQDPEAMRNLLGTVEADTSVAAPFRAVIHRLDQAIPRRPAIP